MKSLIISAAAVACAVLSPEATAQMVRVAPGYVRAPFVRVYRIPGGGVHVRAPFVAIDSPGYRPRYYAVPIVTPEERFEDLNWGDLRREIRRLCVRLQDDVATLPSADFWQGKLQTDHIMRQVGHENEGPPDEKVRRTLTEILNSYGGIESAPDLNRVTSLASFRALRAALAEYVLLPETRLRRQLADSSAELQRALDRFTTGAGWKNYLLLAPEMSLAESHLRQTDYIATEDLADALARYDAARNNPEFQIITDLPAFKTMHARLESYFAERQYPSIPDAEELPAPQPSES